MPETVALGPRSRVATARYTRASAVEVPLSLLARRRRASAGCLTPTPAASDAVGGETPAQEAVVRVAGASLVMRR